VEADVFMNIYTFVAFRFFYCCCSLWRRGLYCSSLWFIAVHWFLL